jgi:serine/threonine-protein kinase
MADTVAAPSGGSDDSATIPVEIDRGTCVGRYLVIGRLGAGGMGVVFAAYDPKLDRKVALKALHAAVGPEQDSAGRARLVREAKAMARLSHPNVVTVYDVVVDGERALVAMELVEGESLRDWLASRRRTWREIVDAFLQAARGLVAAHDAGIVHRDFKLDNVLVGKDGRVRVGDFGLARVAPSALAPNTESNSAIALGKSAEGFAGTPAYMAPDQLRGTPGDAKSDQFAFCTALYEALYGVRPFEGDTVMALLDSIERQAIRPAPGSAQVPRWIRSILVRGLRARPEERYGSMREVLEALAKDPSTRKTRLVALAVALVAVAGVGVGLGLTRRGEAARCQALSHRTDGVWDETAKSEARRAFIATGRPYADDAFARVSKGLDAYLTTWAGDEVAQCNARRAAPGDALATARTDCMDQRLGELRAFVSELRRANAATVDNAVEGARALPGLDVCESADPSRGRTWPGDAALRERAKTMVQELGVVDAMSVAARYKDALDAAQKDAAEASRIGFQPLVAESLLSLAETQQSAGDVDAAERTFHDAAVAAERAGEARVAARAWIGIARRAEEHEDEAHVEADFDHAQAWTDRVGDDDLLRGKLLFTRGMVYSDAGRFDESRALVQKALDLFEKHGAEHEAMSALNGLGIDADMQGRVDEAKGYYGRVLAWREQVLGPDHPTVANLLNNLGTMLCDNGQYDEAGPMLERALAIRERTFGPEQRTVGQSLTNLAELRVRTGRKAEGLDLAQRGLAVLEKVYGPQARSVVAPLAAVCEALVALGRYEDAIAPAERELAILQKGGGADVNVAGAQTDLGIALLQSKRDVVRGRAMLVEARATYVRLDRTRFLAEIDDALGSK